MDTPTSAEENQVRISPEAFVVALGLFLAIALVFAAIRTTVRLHHNQRLHVDDYFLLYAVLAAGACAGVAYSIKEQVYLQIYVGSGWVKPAPDFYDVMLVFEKRIMVCSALIWSVIYAIKFSFLAFFRKLVDRVYKMEVYWWIVVVITGLCGITSIPLSFLVCAHLGNDYMTYCPIGYQLANERIYLNTTTVLDILTDVLIISIPILLLWNVQMSVTRKLTLGVMLCLSAFCIVIAVIRTSLADMPTKNVIDTSWLVFWQGIEAAIAVIIVSCTALRGLFGSEGTFTRRKAAKKTKAGSKHIPGSDGQSDGSGQSSSTVTTDNITIQEKKSKHQHMKSWYKYGGGGDSVLDVMLEELPSTWEPAIASSGAVVDKQPHDPKEEKQVVVLHESVRSEESDDDDIEAQRNSHRDRSRSRSRARSREVRHELELERNQLTGSENESAKALQKKSLGYIASISAS